MFARELDWRRLLHGVWATPPLVDYCLRNGLPRGRLGRGPISLADELAARAAFRAFPAQVQAAIEHDARRVNELASADGNALLIAAGGEGDAPPPDVPAGAGVALWYLVHRPGVFREALLRHRPAASGRWRVGRTEAGLDPTRLCSRADRLAAAVAVAYAGGETPAVTVDGYRQADAAVFEAHVAERTTRVSAAGASRFVAFRPLTSLVFAYMPAAGAVHLYSALRSRTRVLALFDAFGQAVLDRLVTPDDRAYRLDPLKRPLALLPDAADMERARVRTLTLAYPPHLGRRTVTLGTPAGDAEAAVYDLLAAHVPPAVSEQMDVTHAELLVRVREAGGGRDVAVGLWPDACSIGYDWLGARVFRCLAKWGLTDA